MTTGFLYFLPGEELPGKRERFNELGLAPVMDDEFVANLVTGAIDGLSGLLVAVGRRVDVGRLRYVANEQEWRQMPGTPAYVGRWSNEPAPSPETLQRREVLRGHDVEDVHGNRWMVPVCRAISIDEAQGVPRWYCNLPTKWGLNDNGGWAKGDVVDRLQALWNVASRWWDAQFTATATEAEDGVPDDAGEKPVDVTFSFDDAGAAVVLALQTNYAVTATEIDMLGVMTDEFVRAVLNALIDWPTFERWTSQKKTTDNPATPDG